MSKNRSCERRNSEFINPISMSDWIPLLTVLDETLHLTATVATPGQQIPSSSAASDKAINISFKLGVSRCCQA
ncbi:MAG: hypothetical protein ACI915_005455 [Gammaproteobacteria bacterium]|jgi:hypothetical protein